MYVLCVGVGSMVYDEIGTMISIYCVCFSQDLARVHANNMAKGRCFMHSFDSAYVSCKTTHTQVV